jgi:hypothetical protein
MPAAQRRERLPNRRLGESFELEVAGLRYTATIGRFPDGRIGEIFLNNGKAAEGVLTKRGRPIDRGYLYILLNNRTYVGEAVYKGTAYPGEHQPIIPRELWDKVHAILQESPRKRAAKTRGYNTPAPLKGLLFGPDNRAFTPAYTRRGNRLYRYYVSTAVIKRGPEACVIRRVPAAEIEAAIIDQVRALVRTPEIIVRTSSSSILRECRSHR